MTKTMQALVVEGEERHKVKEVPIPEPEEGEVLIKVGSCGLCGTDIHIYKGVLPVDFPLIIGHEVAGEVARIGPGVRDLKEGDHVVLNPNTHCGLCYFCRKGMVHLCENLINFGVRKNGGFAGYLVANERYVHLLPDRVELEIATLCEPLSCCIHGVDLACIKSGDNVVVLGAGTIGLIITQLVKLEGAAKLLVVDPMAKRRELAKKLGADLVLDPGQENILRSVPDSLGRAPDVVIECVGKEKTIDTSWRMANRGGTVVWFGVADPEEEVSVNPYLIYEKELTVRGSFVNPHTMGRAVELLGKRKVDLSNLITHRFSLQGFEKAITTYHKDKERIKIVINPFSFKE